MSDEAELRAAAADLAEGAGPGLIGPGQIGPGRMRLRLPATSANLGSGFDAAAVALDFCLEIEAEPAGEFSIAARGLDAERCGQLEDNLILGIYEQLLREHGRPVAPLAIRMVNGIPLGMGCGSSAAGRLAAIALANHFGELGWTAEQILEEACALEGHPDNAAACWLGGFVAASSEGRMVHAARVTPPEDWRALLVLPAEPLATSRARSVLPDCYDRADVVANLQAAALLGVAFAQGRGELLRVAMKDRIHQPYRAAMCELLPRLLPLAGGSGILGVALSGAGPAVLAVVESEESLEGAREAIRSALHGMAEPVVMACRFSAEGALASQAPRLRSGQAI
jgi:homoserine kinase